MGPEIWPHIQRGIMRKKVEKKVVKKVVKKKTSVVPVKKAPGRKPGPKVFVCICCGKTGIMTLPPLKCKNCESIKSYVIRTDLKVPESYEE